MGYRSTVVDEDTADEKRRRGARRCNSADKTTKKQNTRDGHTRASMRYAVGKHLELARSLCALLRLSGTPVSTNLAEIVLFTHLLHLLRRQVAELELLVEGAQVAAVDHLST